MTNDRGKELGLAVVSRRTVGWCFSGRGTFEENILLSCRNGLGVLASARKMWRPRSTFAGVCRLRARGLVFETCENLCSTVC